jgi:hypothetical protein
MRRVLASEWPIPVAAVAGSAWLSGGSSLLGPLASLGLPLLIAGRGTARRRFCVALAYYAVGCWPIVSAVLGYWGEHYAVMAWAAWAASAAALSLPWALPPGRGGLLAALLLTALPPLGVIDWLSPMNAAGVLFPGGGWVGVIGLLLLVVLWPAAVNGLAGARIAIVGVLAGSIVMNLLAVVSPPALMPQNWVGVQTHLRPGDGNILASIQNSQRIIEAGLRQGVGARVVVFPEAVLPDWYDGTRSQFAAAVPPGQVWLLGVQTNGRDAVVRVKQGDADPVPVAQAAGLLLGGDWQLWNPHTLRPAWWQRVFALDGQRVWAAICVEQVQPWTWLEALWQRPTVILAQSNAWWAAPGSAAPGIQDASTRAWARLMGVKVVTAVNRIASIDVVGRAKPTPPCRAQRFTTF